MSRRPSSFHPFSAAIVASAALVTLLSSSSCKKTQTPSGPRTCKEDADCVIACESRESCCHHPYCESAQHRDDASEIRQENEKRCKPEDFAKCPVVGAREEVDYTVRPKCAAGACIAEKTPVSR